MVCQKKLFFVKKHIKPNNTFDMPSEKKLLFLLKNLANFDLKLMNQKLLLPPSIEGTEHSYPHLD